MSDKLFKSFSDLIYSLCGIYLPLRKKTMLTSRLMKRLSDLNISSMQDYYDYLLTSDRRTEEIIKMIDAVTTNKTEFFRDERQFNFLSSEVLPLFLNEKRISAGNRLNIWSAGCSTGEEIYTLAIVLAEFYDRNNIPRSFSISGSDISTRVLDLARAGVYKQEIIEKLPKYLLNKYFNKKKTNKGEEEYQVNNELKKYLNILRFNLMDSDFKVMASKDIIFCRNVIIYFDRKTQHELFEKFYHCLNTGGFIFIGSSESLFSITDKFRMVAPSIYEKVE